MMLIYYLEHLTNSILKIVVREVSSTHVPKVLSIMLAHSKLVWVQLAIHVDLVSLVNQQSSILQMEEE